MDRSVLILFVSLICSNIICSVVADFKIVSVSEATAIGSKIHTLPTPSLNYEYSLYQWGDPRGLALFSVTDDGEVTLKDTLLYEIGGINSYYIIAVLRDKTKKYGGKAFTRRIDITDSNNHSPKFAKKLYIGEIEEGLPAGSIVQGLEDCFATDLDSSGVIGYEITEGNNKNEFMLETRTVGNIKLLVVKTRGSIDRDEMRTTPYLDLGIRASDGGVGKEQKFAKTAVRIKILDRNDNPPVFIYSNWQQSIQENAPIASSVMRISASDNDEGQNSELYYYFKEDVSNFYINPSSGEVIVANYLDTTKTKTYDLTVVAQDKAITGSKSAETSINIDVLGISGNPSTSSSTVTTTRFEKTDFTVTVRGDLPVKAFVYFPIVKSSSRKLRYSLTGSETSYFKIAENSGVITLARGFNPRITKKFNLRVTVSDETGRRDSTGLIVNISPINMNRYSPVFNPSTVTLEIKQDINVNTEIDYTVQARDRDSGKEGTVSYYIIKGSGIGSFAIASNTGRITTKVAFKKATVYDLYIRAEDDGSHKRYGMLYMQITVKPSYNSAPVLTRAMYTGYINEGEVKESFVGAVFAASPGPGKSVIYEVTGTLPDGLALDRNTGVITTTLPLDYEQESTKFMGIEVHVQGVSKKSKTGMNIIVNNVNDNKPEFIRPRVTVNVAENSGDIPSLVCLFATDSDGMPVSYSIKGGNDANIFSINPQTGQLSAKNLDYEQQKDHTLTIEASDGGNVATATVHVLVQDGVDPPQFDSSIITATVDEGAAENTMVATLEVRSEKSDSHICAWGQDDVTPEVIKTFTLVTASRSCMVKVSKNAAIQWKESLQDYRFSISAINKDNQNQVSTASLVVSIKDKNDHQPEFSQSSYAITLLGIDHIGKSILKVEATDLDFGSNGIFTYSLEGSNLFSMESSGNIFVQSSLDENQEYELMVNAQNQGSNPSSVPVKISVVPINTELPKFTNAEDTYRISEMSSVGAGVFTITVDNVNADFEIVGGNDDNAFQTNSLGRVTVKNGLDFETKKEYVLIIRATVPTSPPQYIEKAFTIKLTDENDHEPVFPVEDSSATQKVYVDQYSPDGTIVAKFQAYDQDFGTNGLINYRILETMPFEVSKDGTITTTSEISVSVGTTYNFKLQATDSSPSNPKSSILSLSVEVKEGSRPETFTSKVFRSTLGDSVPIGTNAAKVMTTNMGQTSTATFKISSGDWNNSFCIDYTKIISVIKPIDFDKYHQSQYGLIVEMTYGYLTSQANVIITQSDENDNSPKFVNGIGPIKIETPEDTSINTILYTATAKDADFGPNGQIKYSIYQVISDGISTGYFTIGPTTGQITLTKSFDFETNDKYTLIIKAGDLSTTDPKFALQAVEIQVTDINDLRPTFTEQTYYGYISKNEKPGYQVLTVHAADFDSGKFGFVEYSISGQTYEETFSIGKTTGVITLLKPIALINSDRFELNIIAKDSEGLSAQARIILYAITEEGPPKFALTKFTFNVTEGTDISNVLGIAKAISIDSLTYSIVRGNDDGMFRINPSTGEIFAIKPLDAETSIKYTIYVRSTDLSERFTEASIEINIANINDNKPIFKNVIDGFIEVVKPRSLGIGQEVVQLEANDKDVGDQVSYKINTNNARTYFEIQRTNVIVSRTSLEDLATDTNIYTFDVIASDLAGQTASVKVRLVLIRRRGELYVRSITEGQKPTDTIIINIPYIKYEKSSFEIVSPSKHPFTISSEYGVIGLLEKLDYEKQNTYTIYVQEKNKRRTDEYSNYKIQINVIDENDNPPKFTMTNFMGKINKNAQPGTPVITLLAEDPDDGLAGEVYFELLGVNPFSIDPVTHEIKPSGFYLTEKWYNISVLARDKGRPQLSSEVVTVYIETGDNPPEFDQNMYQFEVSELAQSGKVIGQVSAKSFSGIRVQFSIEGGQQEQKFSIDSSGQIILQGSLDYESGSTVFTYIVKATEMSTKPLSSTANVVILVKNENDNPPEFTQVEYRSPDISENSAIGRTLISVSATDCDCGRSCKCPGGILTYSLDKYQEIFRIDPVTGDITNIRRLDYDTQTEYRFQVKVDDSGENAQSGIADVVIVLANENDNSPTFSPNTSTISLAENVERGTIIITVQAKDLDNDEVTYAIESGDQTNFEIGEKTGVVRVTTKRLPAFTSDTYVLVITATDGVNTGRYTLNIRLEDINDNVPDFKLCKTYRPIIREQSPIGTDVITVTASDNDRGRNGEVEYYLEELRKGGGAFLQSDFKIDNTTGLITTNKVFDREEKSSYIVLVIAQDGGYGRNPAERNSASCQLEILIEDINDFPPVFSVKSYDISVAEDTPVGTVVLEVSALDRDEGRNAEVTYSIRGADSLPQLTVDPKGGQISIAEPLKDRTDNIFIFQVVATDGGDPQMSSTIEVTINVQSSNPPKFDKLTYEVRIREDQSPPDEVITVRAVSQTSTDPSNKIFYSILPGNLPSTNQPASFIIEANSGIIKVARVLDYEVLNKYDLTVSAVDSRGMKSNAKVYVYVEDVNDNTPLYVLSSYDFGKVKEGSPIGTIVEQVNATDADSGLFGEVRYSLEPSNEADFFEIDAVSGKISTKRVFDREVTPKFTFTVKAQDMDPNPKKVLSSVVYVTILVTDINDNKPVFKQKRYDKTIDEDLRVESNVIEIKADDNDAGENARLNYYITAGNEKGYFSTKSVHRKNSASIGFVTVARKLDREDQDKFELKVVASDSKNSAECTVVIKVRDVNDNDPVFKQSFYNASIPENTENGVFVLTVEATDRDSLSVQQEITYQLAKETDGYFDIEPTTGRITTGIRSFDRELKALYTFLVFASDGVRTGSATVKVTVTDINDEIPEFTEGPYIRYVQENQKPGAVVGFVTATDRDEGSNAQITYTLKRDAGKFEIDINTGLIRTSKTLDREGTDSKFTVVVTATDRGATTLQGEVDVTIIVTDANDQYPEFTEETITTTLKECADIGEKVTQLFATDKDININAELIFAIASGNTPRRFRIDPETGIVAVAHRLNYETEKKYKLFINVRDKGIPQLISKRNASVSIDLTDCNDNNPVFSQTSYTVDVYEDEPIGYQLITVIATDQDTGVNGQFDFFIENPYENYQFIMERGKNASSGVVLLNWKLDREELPQYIVTIGAKDRGTPPLTAYAQLVVNVLDRNDNGPTFEPADFCGNVMENELGVQTVATISVKDVDDDTNGCPCTFEIVEDPTGSSTTSSLFGLSNLPNGKSAEIKTLVNTRFDREETGKQTYTLRISATDNGTKPMTSYTTVTVVVGDKNDNIPKSGGEQSILLNNYQDMFPGGDIGKVFIIDNDRGTNDLYSHTLTSGDSRYFSVNNKGMVVVNKGIPSGKTFKLNVKSTETNRASTVVDSKVSVKVRKITEKLVQNSLPIRMFNVTKDLTCRELKYPDFEDVIAEIMGVDPSQVIIFSSMNVTDINRGTDIWFSVIKNKGADSFTGDDFIYYDSMDIFIKLLEYRRMIEERTGGRILSIGIDACANEACSAGFCTNRIVTNPTKFSLVTDENGIVPARGSSRTFVSLYTTMNANCIAEPEINTVCSKSSNPCMNGGTCTAVYPTGFSCSCLEQYTGPRCEMTTRYLKGNGYFWLKPLQYFITGEISFEFKTTQPNGLLLFQGPIGERFELAALDFLAVDLIDSKLRLIVTQGELKVFEQILVDGDPLNDGVFHHVQIIKYKKEFRVIVDRCINGEMSETTGNPSTITNKNSVQDRSRCEMIGTTPGRWKFINGLYPLQIGGLKDTSGVFILRYSDDPNSRILNRYEFTSFKGCVRNIIDNGVMYDLKFPLEERNTAVGCPSFDVLCPVCMNGFCDRDGFGNYMCRCKFGWTGRLCNERTVAYRYLPNSYSRYTLVSITGSVGPRILRWFDKYITSYMFQLRTTDRDGVIIYERNDESDTLKDFSSLEIVNGFLQYRYRLGGNSNADSIILPLEGVNISDGRWHNVSLFRRGVRVELKVWTEDRLVGYVVGSEGTYELLDTNGVIFVGGSTTKYDNQNGRSSVVDNLEACISHLRFNSTYIDEEDRTNYVVVTRENVDKKCKACITTAAPCLVCVNGGTLMAGSPAYCVCPLGFTGPTCSVVPGGPEPITNERDFAGIKGFIIVAILVLAFLAAILLLAAFVGGYFKKKGGGGPAAVFVEPESQQNIMQYNEEGAGDDDFLNYDLEKLLQHTGGRGLNIIDGGDGLAYGGKGGAGMGAGGAGMGAGGGSSFQQSTSVTKAMFSSDGAEGAAVATGGFDGPLDTEPLLHSEAVYHTETSIQTNNMSSSKQAGGVSAVYNNQPEEVDVAAFISSRLEQADSEDAAYPRDTLLHYGYEGDGSDVDDLSELDDSDDNSEFDDDFSYIGNYGPEFQTIYRIYHYETDEDV